MIELKAAVEIAKNTASDVFGSDNPRDILLEGVDKDREAGLWIITISFIRNQSSPQRPLLWRETVTAIEESIPREVRVFKRVVIDIQSGEMLKIDDYGSLEAAE